MLLNVDEVKISALAKNVKEVQDYEFGPKSRGMMKNGSLRSRQIKVASCWKR